MAELLSDRYQLDIRLGRDGDVVEWLGTDRALERPVLVRILNPAAAEPRVDGFLAAVRSAAAVGHVHLADVYAADRLNAGGAYAVQEWAGGVSLAHRLEAGEPLPMADFLPNAAGLAEGLAALHAAGIVHGAIAASTVLFSAAHPAKLAGFGRQAAAPDADPSDDVQALARVLAAAATGRRRAPLATPPSDVRVGLPRQVDAALQRAHRREMTAADLAAALHAAPTAPRDRPGGGWSWRWVAAVAALFAIAAVVAAAGLALRVRPSSSRLLFPAAPVPAREASPATTGPAPTSAPASAAPPASPAPEVTDAGVYDPFGDAQERDTDLPLLLDGDAATGWRTERYLDPLDAVKAGVGVTFSLDRTPEAVEVLASDGTGYSVAWAPGVPGDFDGWEHTARGRAVGGRARVQLPPREGGVWLLWLVEVPPQEGGEFYYAHVYEVRFRS